MAACPHGEVSTLFIRIFRRDRALAKGADQALVLTVMTPTDITRDAGVQKTIFVVLTGTPE
jgi:hypothetical protein